MAGDVTLGNLIRMLTNNVIRGIAGFTGGTFTNPTIVDAISKGTVITSTQTAVTSTTTPVTLASSPVLTAGGTYEVEGYIPASCNASGGAKFELAGDANLTTSALNITAKLFSGTTLSANTTLTGLGSTAAATAAVTDIEFIGSLVVGVAGALNMQFAQNSATTAASTASQGALIKVTRSN